MIYGSRVKQAREFCGYTQAHLAEQINAHQTTVAYVESGRLQPSDDLVARIALATKFPPAFFRQGEPPSFPEGSLLFRARTSMTAGVRDQARRYGEVAFEVVERLASRLRVVSPRLPRITGEPSDVITAAQFTRNVLGLSPDAPIPHLVRAAEKCGVFVLAVPFGHSRVDAFSSWAGTEVRRPVIVTFSGVPGDRLRFSVAHELGHLALHQTLQGSWHAFDKEADQFAAELLMPRSALLQEIETPVTLTSIAALKKRWGVSLRALVRRAHDLELVSDRQYRYLVEQLNDEGWRLAEPIEIRVERPRAPRRMAELLYPNSSGDLDYARMAADVNLTVQRVKEIMSLYEGGRDQDSAGRPSASNITSIQRR